MALLGPRQVGKTTLALALAEATGGDALYLDLELPSDRAKLAEPELYLAGHENRLVILDEILAHNQGQLLNSAQIASGLGISGQTVARYLDIMVDLLLVRRLQPWAANAKKRLVRSPKVYVRDSGLLHSLLGIRNQEELMGHPVLGPSWEGFLVENILGALPSSTRARFYRTSAGAEIDLVLEIDRNELWAIEIKRSVSNPSPSKGFYSGCEDIEATRRIVLYPGKEKFKLGGNTEATPLIDLIDELAA